MTMVRENVVVVGVDGSASATTAALWAGDEAHRRRASLRIVHGFTVPVAAMAGPGFVPPDLYAASRNGGRAVVASAIAAVREHHPGLSISTDVVHAAPVAALEELSEHALMTVVGAHGSHQLTDAMLGSVAARISAKAHGPVVVVRADPDGAVAPAGSPVLVGLDAAQDSQEALGFAFYEAALTGAALVAVYSWDDTAVVEFAGIHSLPFDRHAIDEEYRRRLAEQLAGWAEKYPEVSVHTRIRTGPPYRALLEDTKGGDTVMPFMIVVGTRGRGRLSGLLLGSTSQALIAHAPCPVAVVRDHLI
jgi:nucleotide-binding universal stress UspA family protein